RGRAGGADRIAAGERHGPVARGGLCGGRARAGRGAGRGGSADPGGFAAAGSAERDPRPTGRRGVCDTMNAVMAAQNPHPPRAEVLVDTDALRHNIALLSGLAAASGAQTMAVVKADGYGHGALHVARTALEAGASWIGVCHLDEALALRSGG